MNTFNRLLAIALLIAAIVLGLVVAAVPHLVLEMLQAWTTDAVVTPQDRLASAVLGLVTVVVSAPLLLFELRWPRGKTVLVTRLSDGTAALEVPSIAQRIREEIEALPGVRQAMPQVVGHGRKIDVRLVVLIAAEVDIPQKASEVGEVVRRATEKMGIGLARQRIDLRHENTAPKKSLAAT